MINVIFSKIAVMLYVIIIFSSLAVFYNLQASFTQEDIIAKQCENIAKIGENLLNGGSIIYDTGIKGTIETKNNTITIFYNSSNMTRTSIAEFGIQSVDFSGTINISKSNDEVKIIG
ncbi:MAG: hypothetical protein PHW96_01495 [Candidatus Nanoarchaeia archaeon]|nr:hypothetical protein [Candidatus Nanoarchaeia archaeon]